MSIPDRVTHARRVWIDWADVHGATEDSVPLSMQRQHSVRPRRGVRMPIICEYGADRERLPWSGMTTPPPRRRNFYTTGDVLWTNWVDSETLWLSHQWREWCPTPVASHWVYVVLQAMLGDGDSHEGQMCVGFRVLAIEPSENGDGWISVARLIITDGETERDRRTLTLMGPTEIWWTRRDLDEKFMQIRSTELVPIYRFVNEHAPEVFSAGAAAAPAMAEAVARRGIRYALKRFARASLRLIGEGVFEAIKEMAKEIWRGHPEFRQAVRQGRAEPLHLSDAEAREIASKGVTKFMETMITETVGSAISDAFADDPDMQRRFLTHTVGREMTETLSTRLLQAVSDATIRTYIQGSANEAEFAETMYDAWGERLKDSFKDALLNAVGVSTQ